MYCSYIQTGAHIILQAPIDTTTMSKAAVNAIDASSIEPDIKAEYAKPSVLTVEVRDIGGIPIGGVPRPRN